MRHWLSQWRWVALGVVLGTALGLGGALGLPKWYEAQIAVVPTAPAKSGGLAAAASALSDLPMMDMVGGGSSDADRIQAVFKSRSVTDAVIERFDLMHHYGKRYRDLTRRALWAHCATKIDKKSSVVTLTCEDKDPELAQKMTQFFADYGNQVFRRISSGSAGEERRFLEKRVAEARRDVDDTAQKLRAFQEQHKVIDIGEQSKAVVSALATLKGELVSKELELSYMSSFSSAEEATTAQVRKQISIMQAKLKSLEDEAQAPTAAEDGGKPARAGAGKSDVFPPAMAVPKLRFELERLFRDQKIAETVFVLLTQRYETAKVNEARDVSAFQVLDDADLPTHHSAPNRPALVLGGALLGLVLGCAWVWFREGGAGRRRRGREADADDDGDEDEDDGAAPVARLG